jgi:type III secretion system YscQ/HrcQ family protein
MPLPFDLPALSRGFGELTAGARHVGGECAAAACRSLSALLGREVSVEARAVPGVPGRHASSARVGVQLAALPARGVLEVEPPLVVGLVDLLAGGPGEGGAATTLTPIEAGALELLAIAALDGVCSMSAVEEALAPRLCDELSDVPGALAIELRVAAGAVTGRARLLLPPAAVRAFAGPAADLDAAQATRLAASLRSGRAPLSRQELDAIAPGDVVVIDPPADDLEDLVLPGGRRLRGRREAGTFTVEETTMPEKAAQLPITLEVELARVELSVGELARLEPGGVLTLPVDRRGLVTLRAGERPIARGELVDLDGAIGVRILSVEVAP